jgi:hypothetical protein
LGGPGDSLLEGGPGSDVLRGGPGTDSVGYYNGATRGVSVTPDNVANDGEPGEGDDVGSDVEDLGGTDFNDHLVGTDGPNNIQGGAGDDTIDARGGSDILHGGDGNDVLLGGSGNDIMGALESGEWSTWSDTTWSDRVDCGDGSDYVYSNPSDRLSANCEGGAKNDGPWGVSLYCSFPDRLPPGNPYPIPPDLCADGAVVVSRGGAVVWLGCPRRGPRRCKGVVSLSAPREPAVSASRRARKAVVLGSRRVSIKRGRRVRVRVPLSRRGRRIVAARKSLAATVTLRYRARRGHTRSLRSRILLVAGK